MIDRCALCGRYASLDRHHVYEGLKRKASEKYGAVVNICRSCHQDIHLHPASYLWLKKEMEAKLMLENHWSVDDFIDVFGRNYL